MADTEKITVNMSVVDLGQIDLLVDEGFYSNRTDFIRTAIRKQLDTHKEEVRSTAARKSFVIGVSIFTRGELEKIQAKRQRLDIRVVGMVMIGEDVTPELALATIQSIKVNGVLRASIDVKEALEDADRIR